MRSWGYRNKFICFWIAIISLCANAYAQKIEYSRQNYIRPYSDATQLVANISGHHHILSFAIDENPSIHIFDNTLQLFSKNEVQFKFAKGQIIRIIPFSAYYFLHIYDQMGQHYIWRIDSEGSIVSLTEPFQQFLDSGFKKNSKNIQLINSENKLYVTANTYFREIESAISTVVELGKDLNIISTRKVVFPFKKHDKLRQVTLLGNNLFILKTSRDSIGYSLQLIKGNLNNGKILTSHFHSSFDYSFASFHHNIVDSTTLIYSVIRGVIFLSKVDKMMYEMVPVTLLKSQFNDKINTNYLFFADNSRNCIGISFPQLINEGNNNRSQQNNLAASANRINLWQLSYETDQDYLNRLFREQQYYSNKQDNSSAYNSRATNTSVRFSILNNKFELLRSEIMSHEKRKNTIHLSTAANVVMKNMSYLIFNQSFTGNKRGLLAIHINDQNEIITTDIRVHDKYDYLLPQLQSVNNQYILLPYTYKKEIGLVKITFN